MSGSRRSFLDVALEACAIVVCATVLALICNHLVRRPLVLLPPPRAQASAAAASVAPAARP